MRFRRVRVVWWGWMLFTIERCACGRVYGRYVLVYRFNPVALGTVGRGMGRGAAAHRSGASRLTCNTDT